MPVDLLPALYELLAKGTSKRRRSVSDASDPDESPRKRESTTQASTMLQPPIPDEEEEVIAQGQVGDWF